MLPVHSAIMHDCILDVTSSTLYIQPFLGRPLLSFKDYQPIIHYRTFQYLFVFLNETGKGSKIWCELRDVCNMTEKSCTKIL